MKQIQAFFWTHPFLTSYLFVFSLLQIGLISYFGMSFAPALFFLFFIPFISSYFLLENLTFQMKLPKIEVRNLEWFLLIIASAVCILHLYWLGKIPFIKAWQAPFLSEANLVRKMGTSGLPKWLHYGSTWAIRALLPASALFFLSKKNKNGFLLSLFIGSFYALALLQKSLVLWVHFPILFYCFFQRKWWTFMLVSVFTGCLFVLAIFANNPQLHGGTNDLKAATAHQSTTSKVKSASKTNQISEGLLKRIFIVPGKTLGLWFAHVPKDKPYLYGRDFGPYAKITGQKAADYNLELYPVFYPDYAKQGIKGSVNTAHFMRAYANFGWFGLPLSALFLATFFWFLNMLYRKTQASLTLSLQLFPLLLLSSGSLLTLLFSGGWGLLLLLLLLSPQQEKS